MSKQENFMLSVKDIFRFKNGQTVLAGPIGAGQNYIGPQTCELLVDGVRRQILRIEGEMIPNVPGRKNYRSLSLKEPVRLDANELRVHNVVLQSIDRV